MTQKRKHTKSQAPSGSVQVTYPPRRYMLLAGSSAALILVLRIITTFFPEARLWGLNFAAFLPNSLQIVFFAMSLLLCTPLLYRSFITLAHLLFQQGRRGMVAAVILVLGSATVFWLFRMQTYFLGDGATYLAEQYRFMMGLPVGDALYGSHSAYLTGTVLAYTVKFLHNSSVLKDLPYLAHQFTFWTFGVLCGSAYVAGAISVVRRLFNDTNERLAAFLLILSTPGVLFFFGYVEYYTFFFVCMFFYFYLAQRSLEGFVRPAVPALLLMLATAFHLMALIALPSLLYLWLAGSKNDTLRSLASIRNVLRGIVLALAVGAAYYFISGIYANGNRNIMSMLPYATDGKIQYYTLFSSYHLLDLLNYLFFIAAPISLAILGLQKRGMLHTPGVLLSFINVVFLFFLAVFGNTAFGMARDWDINSALGLAFIFFFFALIHAGKPSVQRSYLLYIASCSAFSIVITWLASNINTGASVDKYKAVIALDSRHVAGDLALNGYEHLRKYYQAQRNPEGMVWAQKQKILSSGYPHDYRTYSGIVSTSIPIDQQLPLYDWLLNSLYQRMDSVRKMPATAKASNALHQYIEIVAEEVLLYSTLPENYGLGLPKAQNTAQNFLTLLPGNILLEFALRESEAVVEGSSEDPAFLIRVEQEITSSSKLFVNLGNTYMERGDFESAVRVLNKGYQLDTTNTAPLLFLAYAEMERIPPNHEKARTALTAFLSDMRNRPASSSSADQNTMNQKARELLDYIEMKYGGRGG